MLVSDFYPDAVKEYGQCDQTVIFAAITKAIRLLESKAKLDASVGYLDIAVCDSCVTLPSFVGSVQAVNTCAGPTFLRDNWYQFHINSVGSQTSTDCGYTDELGEVCTFREPQGASRLVAVVESANDNNKELRVFGWDANGKRIYTPGPSGALQEGFLVPTIVGYPLSNPNAPLVAKIERISKAATNGFVRLVAINAETDEKVLVGYYEPIERTPRYRRIRIARNSTWARVKYKKAYLEVRSMNDWINIENRLALQLAVQAVKYYEGKKYDLAAGAETTAVRMISDEAETDRTPTPVGPQIVYNSELYEDSIWPR